MSSRAQNLEAFVLHRRVVGETSMQVTFLTREKGLIRARFRGGRRQSKQAVLEPFLPLWLLVDERSSFSYVREAQIRAEFQPMPAFAMISGLYLNELLYRLLHPEEEDGELFILYEKTIQLLVLAQSQRDIEISLREFEWSFLERLGYLVSFRDEANGRAPIVSEQYYQLHPTHGFVSASSGFLGRDILQIAEGLWEDKLVLKTAKSIMRCLIASALNGEPLCTRELYVGRVG
jgi:DNA repair protein RecO (recombination protein O)